MVDGPGASCQQVTSRMYRIALSVLLVVTLSLSTAQGGSPAPPSERLQVGEAPDIGISLTPIGLRSATPGKAAPVEVRFKAKNRTGDEVFLPEVELRITGPDGKVRALLGGQFDGSLARGEERSLLMASQTFYVYEEDTIVIVPARPRPKAALDLVRVIRAMPHGAVPGPPVVAESTSEQRRALCWAKRDLCEATCAPRLVSRFGCTFPSSGEYIYTYGCGC